MPGLNLGTASRTGVLECPCRGRNVWCSGEMHRDHTEHRLRRTPIAKASHERMIDAEARKRGDQTGLDTLVVHAVNDDN